MKGMAATVHILCGPAGAGKTARMLLRFRECARSALGSALWLGPTQRGVEAVRERLLGGLDGLCGQRLCTLQELADRVVRENDPAARPLSGVQRRLLAEDILAELQARGGLSHFHRVLDTRGFADGLLTFLVELRRNGTSSDTFSRAAGPEAVQAGGRLTERKARQCARVYARYQQEMRRQQLYDPEGRTAYACELLRRGMREPIADVRAVFVEGFLDFTRPQQDLLEVLGGRVEEVWIALPDEPGEERAELFLRPRATLERLRHLCPRIHSLAPPVGGGAGCLAIDRSQAELGNEGGCRPAGLVHLERQLFRPLRRITAGDDASGIICIEAPGLLGEARMVARQIKTLLLEQVPAEDVLVTLRDVVPYADLLREVFDEYGIPADIEGAEPLTRNPAVALLLRALRLPEEGWPFAGVTALLRNTYFRPRWPETAACPEVPQLAEALLRLLGEPRGREAYLSAVQRWAERPQPGLEDEQVEESRRQRIHELARKCGPFLERFFHAWDQAPAQAALAEHVAWLRGFAADVGVLRAAAEDRRDAAALERLWHEIGQWQGREGRHGRVLDRKTFFRRLAVIAGEAGLPRTGRGPGRVRVLSAALARQLDAPYLFVVGLGERSFPRLVTPPSLFDEQERQALRQAGLDLPGGGDLLPDEMLLFYQVVTRARRRLVLSYPALDERGQELLPSSFLLAVLDCFRQGAVPTERRHMLIEGYEEDVPLSPAESRVRVASLWRAAGPCATDLPADLHANLAAAADLVRLRFREKEHNPYDGLLRDAAVVGELQRLFGPEKVFSPTALEDYVACPFRFFLRHVLGLEPLDEPNEEIEVTRRGQAFHRALARLHRNLKETGVHQPTEAVRERILHEIGAAVDEDIRRAPSPASKELWRLEGQRLLRVAGRYGAQWEKFLKPWQERGVLPRPHFFEVDFGLPAADGQTPHGPLVIRVDGVEVRVSGRIDRVDVAELPEGTGFWVIDYKTGRAGHYTSTDLAEYRRLQLTLYALAVEEVLLAGGKSRPLGLAYWLVAEAGPKVVLPTRNQVHWLEETARWRAVREQLQRWVATLVGNIRRGAFPLQPRSEHCTQTCAFGQVCRITQARSVGKTWDLPLPQAP